jgi:hypothetical protein
MIVTFVNAETSEEMKMEDIDSVPRQGETVYLFDSGNDVLNTFVVNEVTWGIYPGSPARCAVIMQMHVPIEIAEA